MTMTAPLTGNADLDAFLYDLGRQIGVLPNNIVQQAQSGQLTTPVGDIVGYAYKYIGIKYALDNIGTGLTDSPTNMNYFGVHNTGNLTESTNPADYTWYEVSGGFGTTKFLWYQILGGRNIIFAAQAASPGSQWHQDPGGLIDIDVEKLSDLTTDLGHIFAGEATLGSNPQISGTTMTGAGLRIGANGEVAIGNATTNIVWDGTKTYLNGFQISASYSYTDVILPQLPSYATLVTFVADASKCLIALNGEIGIGWGAGISPERMAAWTLSFRPRLRSVTTGALLFKYTQFANGVNRAVSSGSSTDSITFVSFFDIIPGHTYAFEIGYDGFSAYGLAVSGSNIVYGGALPVSTIFANPQIDVYQVKV